MRRVSGIVVTSVLFCLAVAGQGRRPTLRGHVQPALRSAADLGRAPDSTMRGLQLVFAIPPERQAALDQLLVRQQDPASPEYHSWLSPEAYAQRFGASDTEITSAVTWLESQDLQVTSIARGRTAVGFEGSLRKVEAAFGTQIHRYSVAGETHFANVAEPSVGAALQGRIAAVRGLHDFRLRHPRYTAPRYTAPRYTSPGSGTHYLAPDDYAILYNLKPLYAQNITGAGQKIVVVGQSQVPLTDLQLFRSSFNLPANAPQLVLVPGTVDPGISAGDVGEAILDIDWTGAVARNATIIYVYSDDVTDALYYAIDQNLAPVISMSYGLCEAELGAVYLDLLHTYAKRAVSQGITWVAASGDSGAADCFTSTSRTVAELAVDAPASIPEVTGIGGTTFTEGTGTYWNAINDVNKASVLSYIPETAWNDSTTGNLASSGGGVSSFFAKPAWQTGPGVPNDNFRDVPDIALSASAQKNGYLIYRNGILQVVGGTSAGAPAFSGMLALLNQYQVMNGLQATAGMGNVNPRLYAMAVSTPGAFHDIRTGTNMVNPCSSRVAVCTANLIGYSAAGGYDLVTGLGSVDAFNLITNWGRSVTVKANVTVSLTSNLTSIPLSGSVVLTAIVTSTGSTLPTGSVSFFHGTTQLGAGSLSVSSGRATATLSLQAAQLNSGSNQLTAKYNGDSSFNTANSPPSSISVGAATGIVITGAVNAASFKPVVAPGMILAVFGKFLAGAAQSADVVPLPTSLGGVTATIGGAATPLYYVSPDQINLQVPFGSSPGGATLRVTHNGQTATSALTIAPTAPGIFTFANGAPVPDQAAKRGQTITLYTTGEGAATPALISGALPNSITTPRPSGIVSVTVGGAPATIAYLGVPPWAIGVTQINYTIPANAPIGVVSVVVTVGGVASAPVLLAINP